MPTLDIPPDMLNLIMGIGILIGAVQCFFGYRLLKFVLGLTGFLIGAILGAGVGRGMSNGNEIVTAIAGFVGGLVGASVMAALYFVGVFFIGALFGVLVGMSLLGIVDMGSSEIIVLVLAVLGGVVALIAQKLMLVVATAFLGAWNVVAGIAYFTAGFDPNDLKEFVSRADFTCHVMLGCTVVLGIVGGVVQYNMLPSEDPARPD